MKWFMQSWYDYLLAPKDRYTPWHVVLLCRLRHHPEGPIFYTMSKLEPDTRCKTCGDDIG